MAKKEDPIKRGRGRPKGVKNKRKYVGAIESLDHLTPKAVEKLEALLDEKIKGTTPAQVLNAARLVLELAAKEYERDLKGDFKDKDDSTSSEDQDYEESPQISLEAIIR